MTGSMYEILLLLTGETRRNSSASNTCAATAAIEKDMRNIFQSSTAKLLMTDFLQNEFQNPLTNGY